MKEEETVKKITFSVSPTISFFPFREVLGLGLKILFHKNKEIERMLSKKMTFSLMSLITLLALGFVVSSAMAGDFEIKIAGRSAVAYTLAETDDSDTEPFNEMTQTRVQLVINSAQDLPVTFPAGITLYVTDKDGLLIPASMDEQPEGSGDNPTPAVPEVFGHIIMISDDLTYSSRSQKVRRINVDITIASAETPSRDVKTVILTIPALTTPNPTVATADAKSKVVRHTITLTEAISTVGLPKVVSIQRLRPGSQTVVSAFQEERIVAAPFNVRIVLTAVPHGIDLAAVVNLVEVENGTVSDLVIGVPFTRLGPDLVDAQGARLVDDNTNTPLTDALMGTYRPHPSEGMYEHSLDHVEPGVVGSGTVPETTGTGTDNKYRQYRVTITPHQKSANFDVKVKIKSFHDNEAVVRSTYVPPGFGDSVFLPNGRDILTIPVSGTARNLAAGYRVIIPKDWIIPAGGYLIVAQNKDGSEVVAGPGPAGDWRTNDTPRATHRTPAQLLYNVIGMSSLPNLATAFLTGVVVDVESQHPLVVSEVMWGEDTSLSPSSKSQYIELYNPGGQYKTVADADHTPDVNEALTLIFYASNEFDAIPARGADGSLPAGVTDRIGTLDADGDYWSPTSKGQSGRSGTLEADADGELTAGRGAFVDAVPIVSMYRVIEEGVAVLAADKIVVAFAAEYATDGQVAAGWASSEGPKSANFAPLAIGVRHGTPGAATDATTTPADTAAEEKAAADKAAAAVKKTESTGTIPEDGHIYISEIMFAGGGVLPQWIEISNGSKSEEINLSGWTLTVDNAAADADVSIGASAKFTIADGTTIDASGQQDSPSTILVVTEAGRNNVDDSGQVLDLMKSNEVDLILAGVVTRKYTLLSGEAFMVTLAPPEPAKSTPPAGETAGVKAIREAAAKKAADVRKAATDRVGNLGADGAAAWVLPTDEDGRSSIIRRHVRVAIGPAEPDDGTMEENWVLASETAFEAPTHLRTVTYYGAANDAGTPGFRAGGALPVELSHFSPERNKDTGAVVITWSTQSELNNAGFFIKRSQQRDGAFQVVNATMIAGAGTTSEKQFYTYNDTTAQPNVVYYYQIEDVSLDGNRQTLTKGIRLKGHVSVAGKLTTLWGDLKTSQ